MRLRWLGPGIVHVEAKDGRIAVGFPGDIIDVPSKQRAELYVEQGLATRNLLAKVPTVDADHPPVSKAERKRMEVIVNETIAHGRKLITARALRPHDEPDVQVEPVPVEEDA